MSKPGCGTNDALWFWSLALAEILSEAKWGLSRADTKSYIKHRKAKRDDGKRPVPGEPFMKNGVVPIGVLATRVHDFKGARADEG